MHSIIQFLFRQHFRFALKIASVHNGYFNFTVKSIVKYSCQCFCGSLALAAKQVKCASVEKETTIVDVKQRLQESCFQSISAMFNLIQEIEVAVSTSAMQYKNSLMVLILSLERLESLGENSTFRNAFEEAIIMARAKVTEKKQEFLDVITTMECVTKMITAVSEFSFVIGSESSAMELSQALHNLQIKVSDEVQYVKTWETKYLLTEKKLIEDSKS